MLKLFKILTVIGVTGLLLAGGTAQAEPGGRETVGDPDSPQRALPIWPGPDRAVALDDARGVGGGNQSGKASVDLVRAHRIVRFVAQLRLTRLWSIW